MKPVCVPCGLFFRPDTNGVVFEEGKPSLDGSKVRHVEEISGVSWTSYKLWRGDRWVCRGCGAKIIVGVAYEPISEHYKPDYLETREQWGGDNNLFVHDC